MAVYVKHDSSIFWSACVLSCAVLIHGYFLSRALVRDCPSIEEKK